MHEPKPYLTPEEVANYLRRFYEVAAKKKFEVGGGSLIKADDLGDYLLGDYLSPLYFTHGEKYIYVCPAWEAVCDLSYLDDFGGDLKNIPASQELAAMGYLHYAPSYITVQVDNIPKTTKIPFVFQFDFKKDLESFANTVRSIATIDYIPAKSVDAKLLVKIAGHNHPFGSSEDDGEN